MSLTHDDDLAQSFRKQLVSRLKEAGTITSPALEQAFLTVPREAFVPSFYERDETVPRMVWKHRLSGQIERDHYLQCMYQDESLVIKIDQRGFPISSSSQPTIMAHMLEALDVQPDHQVLEVGSGTGYNAALLSVLTGDPRHVVTIDYDRALTEPAALALAKVVGPGVSVITGDGFLGHRAQGPYDRIIVTASLPIIPLALVKQLRVGGKLVMDLQGPLAGGFLVLTKESSTKTIGSFQEKPLHFMPLSSDELPKQAIARVADLQPLHSFPLPPTHIFPALLEDRLFRWFLQWYIPGCQMIKKKIRLPDSETMVPTITVVNPDVQRKSMVQFSEQTGWQVSTFGIDNLWNELMNAYGIFHSIGNPQVSQYQVMIVDSTPTLSIQALEFSMEFPF